MSDRLCAIQSGPARSASSGANLAVQASRCQGWTSKAGWRELLNHNDVSHADQSRCPRTGRLPTRPAESDPARVHCHMAHRRADDELLDWSNEHEPPPLPAVTRLCAGRDGRWRRPWPAAQDGVEPAARKSALGPPPRESSRIYVRLVAFDHPTHHESFTVVTLGRSPCHRRSCRQSHR